MKMTSDARKYWNTSVSDVESTDVFIRGYNLGELIGQLSFPAATYLLVRGKLPTPGQAKVMDALLCSVLDYSLKKPGTVAARYCVSANPSMVAGIATAVLAVGEYTLAPDDAGRFIQESMAESGGSETSLRGTCAALAARVRQEKRRVPGFGHPNFRFVDPRAQKLKTIAQQHSVWGTGCRWYEEFHGAYTTAIGKPELVINEVGMMAAILVDMGFAPAEMTGIALISSMPGVIAHISEEMQSKVRIRVVPDEIAHYSRERHDFAEDRRAAGWQD